MHFTHPKLALGKVTSYLPVIGDDFFFFFDLLGNTSLRCVTWSRKGRDGRLPGTVGLLSWLQGR